MNSTERIDSAAKAVSSLLAPHVVALVSLLIASELLLPPTASPLLVWMASALWSVGIPMAYVWAGVRLGKFAHQDIPDRRQRLVPAVVGITSTGLGVYFLWVIRVGPAFALFYLSGASVLLAVAAVTAAWKISAHVAVFVNACTALGLLVHPGFFLGLVLAIPLAWSRLRIGAHGVTQVSAGALLGMITSLLIVFCLGPVLDGSW